VRLTVIFSRLLQPLVALWHELFLFGMHAAVIFTEHTYVTVL